MDDQQSSRDMIGLIACLHGVPQMLCTVAGI